MNRILNIFFLILSINTNVYAYNLDSPCKSKYLPRYINGQPVYTHRTPPSCNCVEYLIEKYGRPPEDEPNLLPRHINGIPIYLKRSSSKYDDGFKILHEHFMHSYGYK